MSDAELGEAFARAVAAKDADALYGLLAADIDFRAMTPGAFWQSTKGHEVVRDVILGQWYEPSDTIEELEAIEIGQDVGDTHRVAYRFHVTNADGAHAVEQQMYFRCENGQISWMRVMCAGFRPR
jgi:hypothetical protein